jgi:undecaprenyl-diphosphatase
MRAHTLERLAAWDRILCMRFNRASDLTWVRIVLIAASQLGNGLFWYALIVALAMWGDALASIAVIHMIAVGVVCAFVYKWLKKGTSRLRPYMAQPGITLCAMPLDRYSFPSGHTLHATAFSLVALFYYPALAWVLVPFSVLVALSRVVLGLHYPSDVLAGAVLGAAIASLSLAISF